MELDNLFFHRHYFKPPLFFINIIYMIFIDGNIFYSFSYLFFASLIHIFTCVILKKMIAKLKSRK